ncbi:uncharacterized protein LOC144749544, partial [Ciona intestinalis]
YFLQGDDFCRTDIGHTIICADYVATTGYCCNYVDGYYQDCCYTTAVWGLWYFWFSIVSFLFIVGGVVALCKYCVSKNRSRNSSIADTETAAVPVVYSAPQGPPVQAKVSDFPPSYEQLQHQGVDSQTQQFNSYGSNNPPYPTETTN